MGASVDFSVQIFIHDKPKINHLFLIIIILSLAHVLIFAVLRYILEGMLTLTIFDFLWT